MLVEFTVGNFRSIREPQTFSLEATKLRSSAQHRDAHQGNVFEAEPKLRLLTAAALYGANASGKSNLVKALQFMKDFVLNSSRESQRGDKIGIEPFLLSEATEKAPSFFEIIFIQEGKHFRYGFQATQTAVVEEWLFAVHGKVEKERFVRSQERFEANRSFFKNADNLIEFTRENTLFVSVCAQFNNQTATAVYDWFKQLSLATGLKDSDFGHKAITEIEFPTGRQAITQFIRQMDIGISRFSLTDKPIDVENLKGSHLDSRGFGIIRIDAEGKSQSIEVSTFHPKYNAEGHVVGEVEFELETHESDGTQKLFYFAAILLETLRKGGTMIVDELDARLHPLMTCAIIGLFGDRKSNPRGAQLIFTTHDTNLLSNSLFRRDQIWFAEKDGSQGTNFYSLAEFPVRYDSDLETAYVRGKFGAIPYLGDLREVAAEAESQSNGMNPEMALLNGD